MKLDHALVPAEDKEASARFFAKIMGLEYAGIDGDCGIVRVDDTLLLRFDERRASRVHLAFHVTSDEFDGVMGRLRADSVACGPRAGTSDGQEGIFNDGRRLYFDAPGGLNVELMTVATAGLV